MLCTGCVCTGCLGACALCAWVRAHWVHVCGCSCVHLYIRVCYSSAHVNAYVWRTHVFTVLCIASCVRTYVCTYVAHAYVSVLLATVRTCVRTYLPVHRVRCSVSVLAMRVRCAYYTCSCMYVYILTHACVYIQCIHTQ